MLLNLDRIVSITCDGSMELSHNLQITIVYMIIAKWDNVILWVVILIWTLVLITKFIGRVCPRDSTCLPCNDIVVDLTA